VRKLARDCVVSKRSIIKAILRLFQEAYKLAFHAHIAMLKSFFCACSAIVDSFVIVSFFLEKYYIRQFYRGLTVTYYVCARLCQCFGQFGCYFGCDKPWTCSYTRKQRFLLLCSCTYLNSLGKFGFRA